MEEIPRPSLWGAVHTAPMPFLHGHPSSTLMNLLVWKFSKPCHLSVFMEVSSHMQDRLLTHSPAPHLFSEVGAGAGGGGAESPRLLIKAWSLH